MARIRERKKQSRSSSEAESTCAHYPSSARALTPTKAWWVITTPDRMKYWGKTGAFWGGFWGLLFGSAFFAIPGIGPVLVAGPLVAWIVGGLEGAALVGGLSAIGAGLVGIGI